MYYIVGETVRRLGVAVSTLRYYDKEGLLPFVECSSGGNPYPKKIFRKNSQMYGIRLKESSI